jgi:hypothetical protein
VQTYQQKQREHMKRISIVVFSIAIVICVCAFTFLQTQIRSLERVGIPDDMVRDCISRSFWWNRLEYPWLTKLRLIATGDRAGVVREIATYAKAYTQSAEFKKKYAEMRESNKPTPPEPPKSMAQRRREDKESMQKSIRDSEASMKQMPAEYRATMKQSIDMMKQQLKDIDKPDNPAYSAQVEEIYKQTYDAGVEEYKTRLAEWEVKYPTSPTPMIRNWLTDFLEASKDVDFRAELKDGQYGKKVFVNPEYEAKSSNWKMCYRAGRDVVDAGRASAQQWLNELR